MIPSVDASDEKRQTTLLNKNIFDSAIEFCAQSVAKPKEPGRLRFREVSSPADWDDVRAFRLQQYATALPYMLAELDSDGGDETDERSFVFATWWNERPISTIRLTPYPVETLRYVERAHIDRFLGDDWPTRYLEWSRLLVARTEIERLRTAMMVFATLSVLSRTQYSGYFGYVSTKVTPVFRGFAMEVDSHAFTIASRGDHQYNMVKGDFVEEWMQMSRTFPQRHLWDAKTPSDQHRRE